MTTAEDIEYALTTVGPRITAATVGLGNARPIAGWRTGAEEPNALQAARLAVLTETITVVTDEYPPAVAAGFLRGSCPDLDGESPLILIRQAGADELPAVRACVLDAARAFTRA